MKFGLELELPTPSNELKLLFEHKTNHTQTIDRVGWNRSTYPRWVIKDDSSCGYKVERGAEFVSPPIFTEDVSSLQSFFDTLQVVFDILAEYDDPSTYFTKCGLHVHHEWDIYAAPNIQNQRLSLLWAAYSRRSQAIDNFWGNIRNPDKNSWVNKYAGRYQGTVSSKYGQINVINVVTQNSNCPTVEFRQGGMLTERNPGYTKLLTPEDLVAWVAFTGSLMEAIKLPAGLLVQGCLENQILIRVANFIKVAEQKLKNFDKTATIKMVDDLVKPNRSPRIFH